MQWTKYNYINTIEKIQKLDQYLMNPDGTKKFQYISLDTETNGLRIFKNTIIGFSLSVNNYEGFYIPLLEWVPDPKSLKTRKVNKVSYESFMDGHFKDVWTGKEYPEFFTPQDYDMPDLIPALIQRWFQGARLIMHNAPFDTNHIFIATGVDLANDVFLDTALLSHILNENTPNSLKETASEYKAELGFNPHVAANQEQKELSMSIVRNGGDITKGGKPKTIWRAEPEYQNKYACADTFLTFGVFEVGIQKFIERFGEQRLAWLFEEEVMPVCREVVIPMKRKGVYLDIPYFTKIEEEMRLKMEELEDSFLVNVQPYMDHFTIGKSLDEAISKQRVIKRIIELEGLTMPTKYDKKTDTHKPTLGKPVVKKVYQEDPHWLWGYILGEDEIKYSDEKMLEIKLQLYKEVEGRRYRFNLGSDNHLRWLFCDMLGMSKTKLPQTDSATKENPIPSMAAEVLEEHMLPDYPWVKNLMVFKRLRKLHSTYVLPALKLHIDNWLYMDMRQNGTVSGRFACSGGFNLQTLPRVDDELELLETCNKCESNNVTVHNKIDALGDRHCNDCGHVETDIVMASVIKRGFIAPPGYKIVNADYSSLEPRAFAYMSGDVKLKEVYWEGLDLYSKVYCDMFDNNNEYSAHPDAPNFLKKVAKPKRTEVKPLVLGIPYGSGAYQIAILCNKYKDRVDKKTGAVTKVPDMDYGQWVIDKYLGTYQDLHKYMEDCEISCVTKGYVESIYGRRRHFQYAPKIYMFLRTKGLTHKDLVDCRSNMLGKETVSGVSNLGNKMNFSEQELKDLVKSMKLDYGKCVVKGFWKYIRSLLKNDLNNSKNFPIQSLAGSITNRGMLETTRLFKQNNPNSWVFLQVHDEISCYAPEIEAQGASKDLQVGMEDNIYAKGIDVPMIADPLICDNIKDAK